MSEQNSETPESDLQATLNFAGKLKAELDAAREALNICTHHNDQQRGDALTGCVVCKVEQLTNERDEARKLAAHMWVDLSNCHTVLESLSEQNEGARIEAINAKNSIAAYEQASKHWN